MTISLAPETQRLLEEQMSKGSFATVDEALRAALRTLGETRRGEEYEELSPETRLAIEEAEAQCDRGEARPWQEVRAEILSRFARK